MTVASMMKFHSKMKDFIVFLLARRDLQGPFCKILYPNLRKRLMCLPNWYLNLFLEELKGG